MPQIRVLLGYQQGQVFRLGEGVMVIGRDPKSGIVLHPDSAASRKHAEVFPLDGHWRLRDLGSVNGTAVNGRRVDDEVLRDKDELIIGDNVFVYEDKETDAARIAEAATRVTLAETRGYPNRPETQLLVHSMAQRTKQLESELAKVTGAHSSVIREMLTAIIARGHVVFDDTPACIETAVAQALAEVLGLAFSHTEIDPETRACELAGPNGFSQVLLADGLNRAPLHTQVVLLEAMQEYHFVPDGNKQAIEHPFVVLATQRPGPCNGAPALSEAQLDRFAFSISAQAQEDLHEGMVQAHGTDGRTVALEKVLSARQVLALQRAVRELPLSDHVVKYIVRMVRATRPGDKCAPDFIRKHVHAGGGPQAAEDLVVAAKARAICQGRFFVSVDDVRQVAGSVLRHRIHTNYTADAGGLGPDLLIEKLISELPAVDEGED